MREKYQHSVYYQAKKRLNTSRLNRFTVTPADPQAPFGTLELAHTAAFFRFIRGNLQNADYTGVEPFFYCLAVDLAIAMKRDLKRIKDFTYQALVKKELQKAIAQLRRDQFASRERARRRELADARRKITKRTTTAPMPTPEQLLEAWEQRKTSKEAIIRLGGLLQDLECYVDNRLKVNEHDRIVGRHGGIKGWLNACLPELLPHYKRLMQYKALAKKLRQLTETQDPKPTEALLTETPPHPILSQILALPQETFFHVNLLLDRYLSPEHVLDPPD